MITGGQNFVTSAPVFSNDAKKLLVCTGSVVSIFSTDTGMLVTELEGHADLVTAVIVVPVSESARKFMCYCWTSSLDGTICYWDFAEPELVKKVKDVNKPAGEHKALRGQIQIYNLTNSHRVRGLLAETRKPEFISMSNFGDFIGIRNKQKLHIWKVPAKDIKHNDNKKIKLHHTKKLSTMAFHPAERIVAGGDVTGRILIWRGFVKRNLSEDSRKKSAGRTDDEEGRPGVRGSDDADLCSTWHWHPSEVQILFFSSDGAYLYSGTETFDMKIMQ